jgi:hypothetical protein
MKWARRVMIGLGWVVATLAAYVPIALTQEYEFQNVGWVLTAACLIPLVIMVIGLLRARNRGRA